MNIDRRLVCLFLGAPLLTGCQHGLETAMGVDKTWGEANRQTMAAQIIDPEPDYTWKEMETSGEHAANAVERYRNDNVKKPERVNTSSATGSGSGSN